MLHRIANQEGGFTPKRYFSIDRVFRNETMDATHLCEFHQVLGPFGYKSSFLLLFVVKVKVVLFYECGPPLVSVFVSWLL